MTDEEIKLAADELKNRIVVLESERQKLISELGIIQRLCLHERTISVRDYNDYKSLYFNECLCCGAYK